MSKAPDAIVKGAPADLACLRPSAEREPQSTAPMARLPSSTALAKLRQQGDLVSGVVTGAFCELGLTVGGVRSEAEAYLTGPRDFDSLLRSIERVLERRTARMQAEGPRRPGPEFVSEGLRGLVGSSGAMQKIYRISRQVAKSRATVLISGESGTGKGELARTIHELSPRDRSPFVVVQCAALPETLIESELFGHEKGSFTGADRRRIGKFEQADGGTIFLDEIGEVPMTTQIKLLRVLQERRFERLGGNESIDVDVRLIAATNRNLLEDIYTERFREDLYYRLNVVSVEMPSLRLRGDDIVTLAHHFLHRFAAENQRHFEGFTPAARAKLLAHAWPGNVRELENAVERAVVLCEEQVIDASDLPFNAAPEVIGPLRIPGATMSEIERYAIMRTLDAVGGSTLKAAEVLDLSVRTIQYRLTEWGIGRGGRTLRPVAALVRGRSSGAEPALTCPIERLYPPTGRLKFACVSRANETRYLMLDEFIALNREAIIAKTRARVAARSSPRPSDVEMRNGIPIFLDQLGEALRLARLSDTINHEQIGKSAGLHGHDLFQRGLSIAQVVHDYGDICQVVTALAIEQHEPITAEDFRTLNLCLDDAIADAVTEYARLRELAVAEQEHARLGLLAHQLQNLLSTAMVAFDTIRKGLVAPGGSTGLVLTRSLIGLRDLLERPFTAARLDEGDATLERISVAEFVEDIEIGALLESHASGHHLTVSSVDPTVTVEGDRQILSAAISNLLRNAFVFTPREGNVSLTARATADRVLFDVQDECGGLSPGRAEEMLRVAEQPPNDHSVAGLGLSLCLRAATTHGGSLRVLDVPGKGCVFTLDLPRKPPPPLTVVGRKTRNSDAPGPPDHAVSPPIDTPKAQAD